MCGIAGILNLRPEADPERELVLGRRLQAMSRLMIRRGPDGEGAWRSPDGVARLAFRRLAILDPRPEADQPMVSRRAPCVLVFNGEIYNWRELRRELQSRGVAFETSCDAEVLLEALVEWGLDVLPRLNGMFALGFWDGRHRRLTLARDRFGQKPLFWGRSEEAFCFGSQLNQILVDESLGRAAPDLRGLASFLGYGYLPSPLTLFEGVRQLEPGHVLEVAPGSIGDTPRRYVESPFSGPPITSFHDGGALQEELTAALDRAIKRHLVSDVPRGIFLSSGVDSSLVALTVQRQEAGLFSCTAVGEAEDADESDAVSQFTNRHGIASDAVVIRARDAGRLWQSMVAAYSDPCANVSSLARLELARRAKRDATVMLSGDGGDELFYGYNRMWRQLELARWHRLPASVGWVARAVRRLSGGRWMRSAATLGYGSLSHHYSELMRFCMNSPDIVRLCPSLADVVKETDLYAGDDQEFLNDPFATVRRRETRHHLEYCLAVADRTTMFHGIENRAPLLDLELLAIAEKTPVELCLGREQGKMPLRRRLGELCRTSAALPKRGFEIPPFQSWMEGPLRPILEAELSGSLWPEGLWADDARERLMSWSTDPRDGMSHGARFTVAVLQAWRREILDSLSLTAGDP